MPQMKHDYYPPRWLYGDGTPKWLKHDLKKYRLAAPMTTDPVYVNLDDTYSYREPFSGTDCAMSINALFLIVLIVVVILILYSQKII